MKRSLLMVATLFVTCNLALGQQWSGGNDSMACGFFFLTLTHKAELFCRRRYRLGASLCFRSPVER